MQNPKIKAKLEKFATMQRIKARKDNKMHYEILNKIDKSPKFGTKMEIIGKENLNAEVLNYILAKNKRIAINKLDEKTAKMLDFHYPHDVRRTIQPDEIIHTLQRHGTDSNLVKFSGQKPVTIDEIAKYQDYADGADIKRTSQDKTKHNVLISLKQLDNNFIVVVEQVKKLRNELGFKTMYFEKGRLDEETIERLTSITRKNA